jgi:hypothetical protein
VVAFGIVALELVVVVATMAFEYEPEHYYVFVNELTVRRVGLAGSTTKRKVEVTFNI